MSPLAKAQRDMVVVGRHLVLDMEAGDVLLATTRRDPQSGLTLTRKDPVEGHRDNQQRSTAP